jgi:hypothetical protein
MSRPSRLAPLLAAAMAAAILPSVASAAGGTVVVVNPSDLGGTWFQSTLAGGAGAFEAGPGTPPLGGGSYAMRTLTPDDKVTLVTSTWTGEPLSDLTALDYSTYRDGTSTSPDFVAPSINVAIYTNAGGPGTGFATLVFEPLYSYGNDAIDDDVWQSWDAFAPTQTGFGGGWWATRSVGTICQTVCYTTFADFVANAPQATIISVGVNVGRGPASFIGAVDGLSVTMAGVTTTFDFEPLDLSKDGCKDGGWARFHDQEFRNQGDCVSWYASANGRAHKSAALAARDAKRIERAAAKAERAAERATKRTTDQPAAAQDASDGTPAATDDDAEDKGKPADKGKGAGKGKPDGAGKPAAKGD